MWKTNENLNTLNQVFFAGVQNGGTRKQGGPTWKVKSYFYHISSRRLKLDKNKLTIVMT